MHVLSATELTAVRDGRRLFADVSLGITTGDRIGVIGRNGSGKSTLLRILAGRDVPDAGSVVVNADARLADLPQQPDHDPDASALATVLAADDRGVRDYEARAVLDRLGIAPAAAVGSLSGGQRRRVALAATLVVPADLLILDEPTNHLDVDGIDWLEQRLDHHAGGLLMVTHDRYLLERLTTRMLEIERRTGRDPESRLFWHDGSYSDVLEARHAREQRRQREARRRRNQLRKEIAWLRREPRARASKAQFRVQQVRHLMAEPAGREPIQLDLGTGRRRLGTHVLDLEGVTKRFDGQTVLRDVDWSLGPGERVGLAGPNGSGKTTLLHIAAGRLQPDAGRVERGETVELAVYEQQATAPPTDATVLDTVRAIAPHVPLATGEVLPAGRLCARFGFDGRLRQLPVTRLSGGERRRLALLHTLVRAPNVLILDEPTNDLDLDTLRDLEDHLDGFGGTLVVATHDRFVLDRLTDRVHGLVAGRLREYLDWADYRRARESRARHATGSAGDAGEGDDPTRTAADNRRRQAARRELRSVEQRLDKLSRAGEAVHRELAAAGADHERAAELDETLRAIEEQTARLEERWLELSLLVDG